MRMSRQRSMLVRALATFVALVLLAMPALAVEPDEILQDAALEARARRISTELRCLVCQNQSIDDSNAPLARDLRILVRDRLVAGDSDAAVLRFLVVRYGAFVLLKPPFNPGTLLLWSAPLLLLCTAGLVIVRRMRRPSATPGPADAQLTAAEQARLDELLGVAAAERKITSRD